MFLFDLSIPPQTNPHGGERAAGISPHGVPGGAAAAGARGAAAAAGAPAAPADALALC